MSTLVDILQPPPTESQCITQLQQRVSPSKLALFQSCRLRFWFRHVLGLRKPRTPALHVGAAIHAVLRDWNLTRWWQQPRSLADLYQRYEAAWVAGQAEEPMRWRTPTEQREQHQSGWRLLETFFRESSLREAGRPAAVEVSVEADLARHGLPVLAGVIDLVQNGTIIDFKTSATTPHPDRAALLHGMQATSYSLLYRENNSRKEAGVELHHLVKLKVPKLVVVRLPAVGEREQSRLFRIIDAYVEGLERRDFIPSPGLQCVRCEFFHECAAWH